MIDMHIHTIYSDGLHSAQNILKKANKLNLSLISITDHNSTKVYDEILKNDLLKLYSGSLVTGTELKCHIGEEIIELLVYDFNIDQMEQFIKNNYSSWYSINKSMTTEFENILIKEKITYDKQLMSTHDFTKYNGIMELYKTVLQDRNNEDKLGKELYKSIPEFFRKCVCNYKSRFYVDLTKYYPSVEDVVNFSRKHDCKVFMPHVFLFNNGLDILNNIQNTYKIDGVECFHPSYTLQECNELLDYCKKHNLYTSAGSDYHGNGYELGSTSKFYSCDNIKLCDFKNILKRK